MRAQIEQVPLASLRENPKNARTHPKQQIRRIAESISRFGFTAPIITDENHTILAGTGRFRAAKELGLRFVPIVVVGGLSEAERRAYTLADNKLAEMAGWDRAALAVELSELAPLLADAGLDIEITGFQAAEIDVLLGDFVDCEHDPADDLYPLPKNAVSRRGDLWILGEHRLLCGDAQEERDLRMLMRRERAAMAITDPPYNVRVRSVQGRGKIRHDDFVTASGELAPKEFIQFLRDCFALVAK